jgi:hypothetical protein
VGRWLLALVLASVASPALAFGLDELMALLARHKRGEATFSEQRFVRGLDAPLVSSGTLSFAAPDRMTRRTLKPRPEEMTIDGNTATLTRGGRTRTLALDAAPDALAAVAAMRATLSGDAPALQRHFRTTLAGNAERWTLRLEPRAASGALRHLRIDGWRDEVRIVETELSNGDRSVMTIEPVRAAAAPAS